MADPKGFLKYTREGPTRRPVELRVLDWKEMYEPYSDDKLSPAGGSLYGLWRAVLSKHQWLPRRQSDSRVERSCPSGSVERRAEGIAHDKQFSGVYRTPLSRAVRVRVRARYQ